VRRCSFIPVEIPHALQTLTSAEKHQLRPRAPGPLRATAPVTITFWPRLFLQSCVASAILCTGVADL
jgi:hypothetical protein